jgi:ABC-type Fe3+/spermidine/putrescine transport system ATPase subunit
MTAYLELSGLDKRYGGLTVLDDVSLEIAEGEMVALLGPSGSGKTTMLRIVAGFESLERGAIRVAGEDISSLPPARRQFGMVFQHYALFPHMTVGENVAFGLESRGVERGERRERVREALEQVELAGFEERRVDQISGGQQQRVALARALAPHPRVLLLDEPLSNLDPALRERTRLQLRRAIGRVGITALWVTHEQEEAFDVGNRVAVLHRGRLEQVGAPEALYSKPASPFVARFIGRSSVVAGTWAEGAVEARLGAGVRWPAEASASFAPGDEVVAFFRPEALELCDEADGAIDGTVEERRFGGATTLFTVAVGGVRLEVEGAASAARPGDRVRVRPRPGGPGGRAFAASEAPEQ